MKSHLELTFIVSKSSNSSNVLTADVTQLATKLAESHTNVVFD